MSTSTIALRTADPFRDLAVIDARAPRFNQTVVALLAVVATVTGWWGLLTVLAVQLTVGLLFGRQYCLPCLFYFVVVQPKVGEGPLEDARAPRFANIIGAVCLWSATLLYAAGFERAGWWLGLLVAALASLAAVTGLCVGCELYRVIAKLKGIEAKDIDRVDLKDLGVSPTGPVTVLFTHPLCSDCHETEAKLEAQGATVVKVDVAKRPELARKYGIALVPTVVRGV
ncbi:MAG: DUF4395 family protein [Myxococcaceae bacterium]|nr:DUF4395 family protein [Myxococcaceae bacterium]